MLLWQLTALLPLPLWLQFGASLLCFSWASAGLMDVAERHSQPTLASLWQPVRRAPWPLLLLPLLVAPWWRWHLWPLCCRGWYCCLAWSLALPLLLDQGGEAWDAMARSAQLMLRRRHQGVGTGAVALGTDAVIARYWLVVARFVASPGCLFAAGSLQLR